MLRHIHILCDRESLSLRNNKKKSICMKWKQINIVKNKKIKRIIIIIIIIIISKQWLAELCLKVCSVI